MSPYEELLSKDGSVSMHHKNLQKLVIEIYDVANGLCPGIIKFFRSSMGKWAVWVKTSQWKKRKIS